MAASLFLEQHTQETDRLGRLTSGHVVTLAAGRRRGRIHRPRGGERWSVVGLAPEGRVESKRGEALPEGASLPERGAETVTSPWRGLCASSNCEQLVYDQLGA